MNRRKSELNIFVVDDHVLIREGIKKILNSEKDVSVTGEAASAGEALRMLPAKACDILLLDISLPDGSGFDILDEIKNAYPDIKILILSMFPEDRFAVNAFKFGAMGYVTKEHTADELIEAVHRLDRGEYYVSPSLARRLLMKSENINAREKHELLSCREFRIFLHLAAGQTVKEIAEALNLSVKTVSTYRTRTLEKMKLNNNAEITRYAIKQGLIK